MNEIIEAYLERPTSHKIAIWAATILVVCGIFWQYFYKTQHNKRAELTEQINSLEIQTLQEQRIANDLPKFREETRKLDRKLELVLLELPDRKEIKGLLNSISVLAVDSGLEVTKFAPQPEEMRDFVVAIPVFIEVEGTFHKLSTFFDEVGHLARIVNISQIALDIITETKSEVSIRSSFMATSFRYMEESERPKKKKKKGRRRK